MTQEEKKKIGYNNIHTKLVKLNGKATYCSNKNCNYSNPKRYEWALIHGREYSVNIADYIPLCPSCHRKYDITGTVKLNYKRTESQKIFLSELHKKKVVKCDLSGNEVEKYKSVTEASLINNISRTAISNCLNGLSKKSGGFIWKAI